MTVQLTHLPHSFHSKFFSLAIHPCRPHVTLVMRLNVGIVSTDELPETFPLLKTLLPRVFETQCFNYDRLPFIVEAKHTEIGHLFEHILLTYLCQLQQARGVYSAVYRGETCWNWTSDTRGTFHITIDVPIAEQAVFNKALKKSVTLLHLILEQSLKVISGKGFFLTQVEDYL